MKNRMLRSVSLLCISLMMALSVIAQEPAKLKANDKESKYKSEDLKIKEKKEEGKYKATDLKMKDEKAKGKVKARVHPMHRTRVEETDMKTGETQVRTKEHIQPVEEPVLPEVTPAEPTTAAELKVPETPAPEKKVAVHKHVAKRSTYNKSLAARKPHAAPKYIVRTKVVKDTVYVPSEPIVKTNTEYVHDTVELTRVDTFTKVNTENTYTGYRVPRGNFKKVKLKKDKANGDVWMKRKGEK
jgi:hypothetical protein